MASSSSSSSVLMSRLTREYHQLLLSPTEGISAYPRSDDNLTSWQAVLLGPSDTPYAGGRFHINIAIPNRYPFEPPTVRFETRVYHPNVDSAGLICLDVLHLPPKGSWKPSWNIGSVLTAVQLLLSHANPDDGLMAEASELYLRDRAAFDALAREWTQRYAMGDTSAKLDGPAAATERLASDDRKEDGGSPTAKRARLDTTAHNGGGTDAVVAAAATPAAAGGTAATKDAKDESPPKLVEQKHEHKQEQQEQQEQEEEEEEEEEGWWD